MSNKFRFKLIQYLNQRRKSSHSAFTLVELIVVVVIIGILSAIAIPSFNNAADKAKQKEASTLVAAYTKAAQAYYTEYSEGADSAGDLAEYISVTGCVDNDVSCKDEAPVAVAADSVGWNSPSGLYLINMTNNGGFTKFSASPRDGFDGYGVSSCVNNSTGGTKLNEMRVKGAPTETQC